MKKQYITPEMEAMNVETVDMLATSSIGIDKDGEGGTDILSTGRGNRRGTWGNLWATEE